MKMHADEVHTDAALVRHLIEAQFPRWSDLPVRELTTSGTVNALFKLGDDMVVRLPRRIDHDVEAEHAMLRRLAGSLSIEIPTPLAVGVAWNTLDASVRKVFWTALAPDDAMWMRGLGWALWTGILALPYYRETNPVLAENARYRLEQILGETRG